MFTEPISVVTVVSGRRRQLRNLCRGLAQASPPPAELVVAAMDELTAEELPRHLPYPVRIVTVAAQRGRLPLAQARNRGIRAAEHGTVVLLDVDCIPAAETISALSLAAHDTAGVVMGEVRYLPRGQPATGFHVSELHERSLAHPRRPHVEPGKILPSPAYHLLWTLCLGMRRVDFERVGGLDEAYPGYGAEDTDFAFMLRREGVPFHLSGAEVYHQYHPVYRPPLNRLSDIVGNAAVFKRKWGQWPMEGWLTGFARLGLIDWQPDAEQLTLLRLPTEAELATALLDDGRGFG